MHNPLRFILISGLALVLCGATAMHAQQQSPGGIALQQQPAGVPAALRIIPPTFAAQDAVQVLRPQATGLRPAGAFTPPGTAMMSGGGSTIQSSSISCNSGANDEYSYVSWHLQDQWCSSNHGTITVSADIGDGRGMVAVRTIGYTSGGVSSYEDGGEYYHVGPGRTVSWKINQSWNQSGACQGNDDYTCSETTHAMKPPTGVSASDGASDRYVTITWSKGTDHNDTDYQYRIYRNGSYYTSVSGSARSYTADLRAGQSDTWGVSSYSFYGVTTPNSTVATDAGSTRAFDVPTGVDASDDTYAGLVHITWACTSDYATHYRIYRDGSLIGTVPVGTTMFDDEGIEDNVTYTYTVRAFNSTYTDSSAASGGNTGRGFPVLPNASDGAYTNRVKISWINLAAYADEVKVYRDGDEVGTVSANANTMYDYDAIPGRVHKYGVAPIKNGTEYLPAIDYGFIAPDGRFDGKVQTPTLAGIQSVDISIWPDQDTVRRSASFNGTGAQVANMKKIDAAVAGTFTMEMWVKPSATRTSTTQGTTGTAGTSGQRYVVAPRNGDTDYGAGHAGAGISVGTNGISVFEHANAYLPSPLVYDAAIPSTSWTHVAVVYSSGQPSLYVNGALVATGATSAKTVHPSTLFGDVNSYGPYAGLADEIRFWNYARTAAQIAADTNRALRGDETGLVGYWSCDNNASNGSILSDYSIGGGRHGRRNGAVSSADHPDVRPRTSTDVDGVYSLRGVYYGPQMTFNIMPQKPRHGFRPGSKTRTIDVMHPTETNVDFIDTTAFAIEGWVYFPPLPGQTDSCAAANVEIWVNGVFRGVKTDLNGHFNLSVEEAGVYTLTPKLYNHTFSPASITRQVDDHIVGVNALHFRDTKTHWLSVRARGGSRKCDIPVGKAEITLRAFGTDAGNASACVTVIDSTDIDGNYRKALPAQRYALTVRYKSNAIPAGIGKEETRMWDLTRDSVARSIDASVSPPDTSYVSSEDTLRFNYHAPPRAVVQQFWDVCGPHLVLEQGVQYRAYIDVTETIPHRDLGPMDCDLDSGYVLVYNEVKDNYSVPDTVQVKDGMAYLDVVNAIDYFPFVAGEPNIYANATNTALSYKKKFQVAAKSYDYSEQFAAPLWLLVKGSKSRTPTFFTKSPELPMLIVRRPPGDQSMSFINKGTTLTYTTRTSFQSEGGAGVFVDAKCGAGTTLPFVGKTGVDLHVIGKIMGGGSQIDQTTMSTTWTSTENISTSDAYLGVEGSGDVIMGGSLNMVFSLTDVVDLNSSCQVVRDTSLGWGTQGFATTYVYTIDHIRDVLIPQLTMLRDLVGSKPGALAHDSAKIFQNYIDVWQQVLRKNDSLKTAATFQRNISFSAGAPYTSSTTTTTDTTIEYNWTGYLSTELSVAIGAHAGDFNAVEGGVAVNFKLQWGGGHDTLRSSTQTVGYLLADNDAGDYFSVDVKDDPVYGTPVFKLVAGTSSCPWEAGSQSRDGAMFPGSAYPKPLLTMDRYLATDILPDDKATFILGLTNTSESGETRDYTISVNQTSNLDGAIVSVGGVNIENELKFTIPPGVTRKATMTVQRGPVAYDYDNIELVLKSQCDANIADSKLFGVHFLSPCSNATILEPANNFLISQADGNVMHFQLTDLEKTKIGNDLEVQFRKIGTSKWNTAMFIPRNDLYDQKFKVFETDWNIPPTVTDGQYDIRIKVSCTSAVGGGINYSNVVTGTINRSALTVFGVPEPRDGILNFGDQISAVFSNDLDCGALTTANVSLMFLDDSTFIPPDSIRIDCKGNTLVIQPTIALRRMQNRHILCTVHDIDDVNGNFLKAPLAWQFRVNMNSLVWTTANASATTYKGTSTTVTGTLRNVGGKMESFLISPTREWLSTLNTTGTLPPAGTQDITFVVDDKLNPGTYADTVYALTNDGDEPFFIEVHVLNKPPLWTVNPGVYQYNMEVTCNFMTDTSLSTDANDIVAAFVGTQCRGVANIQYVPSLGVYRAFLTVYSDARTNETVTFRTWKASTGRISVMQETFPFDQTASHGTLINPVILHPASTQQIVPVDAGWNWFSLNTKSANMSPNAVLARTGATANDLLKGQTTYAQYGGSLGWVGTLDTIRVGQGYKINLSVPGTIEVTGALQPATLPIPLTSGWNWIGYMPTRIASVNTALRSLTSTDGDRLKGRDAFSVYNSSIAWEGSLTTMNPDDGYMLSSAAPCVLIYPDLGNFWPGGGRTQSAMALSKAVSTPSWTYDPAKFEHTMNVTSKLLVNGQRSDDPAALIGVFAGDECRGVAKPIEVDGHQMYFLTVFSNSLQEQLSIRAYVPSLDSVLTAEESVSFQADGIIGDPVSPFPIHVATSATGVGAVTPGTVSLEQNYPNPFGSSASAAGPRTSIGYVLAEAGPVTLIVYDMLGSEVMRVVNQVQGAGRHTVLLDAAHLQGGQFWYRLTAGGTTLTRVMTVLK